MIGTRYRRAGISAGADAGTRMSHVTTAAPATPSTVPTTSDRGRPNVATTLRLLLTPALEFGSGPRRRGRGTGSRSTVPRTGPPEGRSTGTRDTRGRRSGATRGSAGDR